MGMTQAISSRPTSPRDWFTLIAFVVVVQAVGTLIGVTNTPGAWYAGLETPPFNPPDWLFAPVWTTLYVLIAIAGWRTFRRAPMSLAMGLWVVQMVLNWLWSPAFFGAENLWLGLVVIVPMLIAILAFIAVTWRSDRTSALLFVLYAIWVSFATLLNVSLIWLN